MGAVYVGVDPRTGDEVALKVMSDPDPRRRERFAREALALSRLRHPAVVAIRDAGQGELGPWVALDLVRGGTLAARLAEGPLAPRDAARLLLTLAGAIQAAHEAGVLHRDLKPENVLLTRDGEPVLTDFGLAGFTLDHDLAPLTRTGAMQGTPGWWAPEQAAARHDELGPGTDVYGLGALLHAALTGQPPVEGASLVEVLARTLNTVPLPSGLDPRLDAIMLRCLEKQPRRRYPSAAALAAALEHYLAAPRPGRAGRWLAASILGAVLVAASALRIQARAPAAEAPAAPDSGDAAAVVTRGEDALLGDAGRAYAAGELERALELCDQAAAQGGPRRADALAARGAVLSHQGDLPGAMAAYEQALAHDPDHVDALRFRARARLTRGQHAEARRDLERAVRLAPGDARLWHELSGLDIAAGDLAAAQADLDRAIACAPEQAELYRLRARLRLRSEQGPAALEDFGRALRLEPEHGPTWRERGGTRLRQGDREGALRDLDRALELTPEDPWAWTMRAEARIDLSLNREALSDLDQALKLTPKDGYSLFLRGRAWMQLQGYPRAEEALREALQVEPAGSWAGEAQQLLRVLETRRRSRAPR